MENNLEGKRIIVTGGGGGIVSAWCEYFAEQGASVLVNDVGYIQDENKGGDYDVSRTSHKSADDVVGRILKKGHSAEADYENVSDIDGAKRVVEHCMDAFGGVDILLNATCVSRLNECVDMDPEEWETVIRNNLYPVYNMTKQVLPYMKKQKWGRLLYTNSCTVRSFWGSVTYAASYGGVYSFMRCIANEVRPDNITANCIEPTAAGKTGARPAGVNFLDRRAKALGLNTESGQTIISEMKSPRMLAPFVAYLCTDYAKGITGQSFALNGSRYAIYSTLEEKKYIFKSSDDGEWTIDELKHIVPGSLEQDMVKLWYPRV